MGRLAQRLARRPAKEPVREVAEEERSERLAALRTRLGKMIDRQARVDRPGAARRGPPSRARNVSTRSTPHPLPFESVATPAGQLHVRSIFLTPAQRMGTVGLAGALRADAGMLSLLSLTPEIARRDMARAVYLDAETTGLGNGTGNYPFLMGVCSQSRLGTLVLQQYLLRDPCDEPALLARMHEHISEADLIVSYNGKSFDMPLLRSRFVMNRMKAPVEPPHLDLLHVARRVHKRRTFRKSLTTLEKEVLGFHRGPNDVAGAEVAERYLHYLHARDESQLADVVEHNELDVLTLVALTSLYGQPLSSLEAEELASVADVIKRAGDLDRARAMADEAVERGAIEAGLFSRALIHKARGDREHALADFQRLEDAFCGSVIDAEVRLELAKLYEHYAGDCTRALEVTLGGTSERPDEQEKRRERLRRKLRDGRPRKRGAAPTRVTPHVDTSTTVSDAGVGALPEAVLAS